MTFCANTLRRDMLSEAEELGHMGEFDEWKDFDGLSHDFSDMRTFDTTPELSTQRKYAITAVAQDTSSEEAALQSEDEEALFPFQRKRGPTTSTVMRMTQVTTAI